MAERGVNGLGRLLSRLVLAGVGVIAAPGESAASERELREREVRADSSGEREDEDVVELALAVVGDFDDAAEAGHTLAVVLEHMHPFDATRLAATAALDPRVLVRRALGEALTWVFELVGDDVVIDHLSRDEDVEVRFAAVRAAHARHASGGDGGVLARMCHDDSSFVAHAAVLALLGAPPLRR